MIPPSPSLLTPPPSRTPGVRRMNRMPIVLACTAAGAVVFAVGWTLVKKSEQNQALAVTEAAAVKTQGSKTPGFLTAPPPDNVQAGLNPKTPKIVTDPVLLPPATAEPRINGGLTFEEQARAQAWQTYYQAQAQAVAAHNALEQTAHAGNMDPLSGAGGGAGDNGSAGPPAAPGGDPYSVGGVNPAGQTGKQAFLRMPGDPYGQDEDLKGSVHGPKPNTIMEGTGIPLRLTEGATSDMPGQLNAEILQNVYDSMTGDVLLIPQGTKIVGTYDVAVSAGQSRIGVIWNRLVFPDTSSRQIGTMSGADQAGLGGMKDLLDTHFWEKFGSAIMVSLIGAGAQLSQPQQSAFATPSGTSSAASAMTQQLSQFGQEQARAGLSIPNTIELRPGLTGLIKVNKDMTLPAWVDRRTTVPGSKASMTIGKLMQ